MTPAPFSAPPRATRPAGTLPPLTLADLASALCAGFAPGRGLDRLLDRLEGRA